MPQLSCYLIFMSDNNFFDISSLPYRPCVGIALFNSLGQVFVGERIDTPTQWQMPQGGIDEREGVIPAAFRELKEETGITNVELLHIVPRKVRYDVPPELSMKHWGGRFRGQEQNWVALKFLGCDQDIDLKHHEPHEFSRWQWVELEHTLDLIVPFKRDAYREVIGLLSHLVPTRGNV